MHSVAVRASDRRSVITKSMSTTGFPRMEGLSVYVTGYPKVPKNMARNVTLSFF